MALHQTEEEDLKGLLYDILDALEIKPSVAERRLRLSGSGKKARYHAHVLAGSMRGEITAQSVIKMQSGNATHDIIRDRLAEAEQFEVLDREREIWVPGPPGYEAPVYDEEGNPTRETTDRVLGHIDLRLKDTEYDEIFLVDIKDRRHGAFCDEDPRNDKEGWWKRSKLWTSGHYVFDAIDTWGGELFSGSYMYQLASYMQACRREGIEFDRVLFMNTNRNMGHIALGLFLPSEEEYEQLIHERDQEWKAAVDEPDPFEHPPCWPVQEGKELHVVCSYCNYRDECFDTTRRIYRGKPKYTVDKIHGKKS